MPAYKGATPTKAEDDDYTYEFIGWTPEIDKVTGDIVYKATFKAIEKTTPKPTPAPKEAKVAAAQASANALPQMGDSSLVAGIAVTIVMLLSGAFVIIARRNDA